MSERIHIEAMACGAEDAITAGWLDDDGPYIGLPLEPNDEQRDADIASSADLLREPPQ
jgi:hypothetical protein